MASSVSSPIKCFRASFSQETTREGDRRGKAFDVPEKRHATDEAPLTDLIDEDIVSLDLELASGDKRQRIQRMALRHDLLARLDSLPLARIKELARVARLEWAKRLVIQALIFRREVYRAALQRQARDPIGVDRDQRQILANDRPQWRRLKVKIGDLEKDRNDVEHAQPEDVAHQERNDQDHIRGVYEEIEFRHLPSPWFASPFLSVHAFRKGKSNPHNL